MGIKPALIRDTILIHYLGITNGCGFSFSADGSEPSTAMRVGLCTAKAPPTEGTNHCYGQNYSWVGGENLENHSCSPSSCSAVECFLLPRQVVAQLPHGIAACMGTAESRPDPAMDPLAKDQSALAAQVKVMPKVRASEERWSQSTGVGDLHWGRARGAQRHREMPQLMGSSSAANHFSPPPHGAISHPRSLISTISCCDRAKAKPS